MTRSTRISRSARSVVVGLAAALVVTALTGTSSAQQGGQRQPVPYVERSIALPALTLAPGGRFNVFTVPPFAGRHLDPWWFLSTGARFGIIDQLEIEATPFQSVLAPEFAYGGSAGITGDFLDGPFELGVRLRVFWSAEPVVFTPSIPMRVHIAEVVRIDTGVAVSISTQGEAGMYEFSTVPVNVEPGVPARVAFQIVDPFWLGIDTGFGISDFTEAGHRTFVPLGLRLGGTVPGDSGPILDIEGGFSWPTFVRAGAPDGVVPEVWNAGLQLQGYIYL